MARTKQQTSLKGLVKSALVELIEENEDLLKHLIEEAVEDAFLSHAIKEGKKTRKVSRERIFSTLTGS